MDGCPVGCRRRPVCHQPHRPACPPPPGQALGQAQPPFAATLPFRRDDGEYAGSDSCRDCHANEHKSWHASYHRTMTQLISPETVRAAFDGQAHEFQGERFTMHRRGDEYWTSIESIDAANASPDSHDPGGAPPCAWAWSPARITCRSFGCPA